MRRALMTVALVASLSGVACSRGPSSVFTAASGARALSRDDVYLYVVEPDAEQLRILDVATEKTVATVQVGRAPERVAVGSDDSVYVTNRGSRSVSVIRRGDWREAARLPAGIEPLALTVSRDGQTLYVVNGSSMREADVGTLTAIDTKTHQIKWDLPVGAEPRDITLLDNGDALITLHRRAEAVRVDLSHPDSPKVTGRASPVFSAGHVAQSAL